ncbi:MAG: hypothetical protein D6714_16040 [Bacteroidetes bacterium]|nr:MAG: hypothetical protein D6714_16040 [Bacteroidota bacterium]
MKAFTFKKRASVISTLKEPPVKPPARFNFHRLVYVAILLGIAGYVGKRIYAGLSEVRGEGQVEFKKQSVTFTDDIEVLKMLVSEGDTIRKGDTLFFYRKEMPDVLGGMADGGTEPVSWVLREKLNLEKEIALKKIKRNRFIQELDFKKDALRHYKELRLLGVSDTEVRLPQIQEEILSTEAQLKVLNREIQYLRQHLSRLTDEETTLQNFEREKTAQLNQTTAYVAKMDGIIGQINFNEHEVCYEKQDLLTIHKMDEISIKGYFDPQELPHIQRGARVAIRFPDGGLGTGIIHNFYVSTYALPAEFQNKYEPVERNVVVDILPLNELEARRWTPFYKMQVEIVTPRFKFLPKV